MKSIQIYINKNAIANFFIVSRRRATCMWTALGFFIVYLNRSMSWTSKEKSTIYSESNLPQHKFGLEYVVLFPLSILYILTVYISLHQGTQLVVTALWRSCLLYHHIRTLRYTSAKYVVFFLKVCYNVDINKKSPQRVYGVRLISKV